MREEKTLKLYYFATILAVVLWGASFIATKIAYQTYAPIQLGAARILLAAIFFRLIRAVKKDRESIQREDLPKVILSGFLGTTLYFTLQNIGVEMTSASNSALIVASFPAMTMLLEYVIYRTRPTLKKLTGIVLSVSGVAILSQISPDGSDSAIWGNLLMVGAGVVWAFYNFLTRSVVGRYSSMTLTYHQMLSGFVFFIPFVLLEGSEWKLPNPATAGALLYLGVGCSLIAFLLYNLGLRKLSASASVSMLNLVPVVGLILSVIVLKESISIVQLFGGAVVVAGVTLSSKPQNQEKNK
jgi:drug/metabolite transporter (DMT)-like permease